MEVVHTIKEVRLESSKARIANKTIGFVPTMGALHAGHESLIKTAKQQCGFVIVSVFVNPTQFEPGGDFQAYPRTLDEDLKICEKNGVDVVFAPSVEQMYPLEILTWVNVEKMTDRLCGAFRPGHFKGVTTVCAKLFNIVGADKAYFGQKDAQQLAVIKRMVIDLNFPLEIVGCPTIRQENGLAMSSRNKYLTEDQKHEAALIYGGLQLCELMIKTGEKDPSILKKEMEKLITSGGNIKIEYLEIADLDTLEPIKEIKGNVLVAIAAYVGKARLIDNIIIEVD